MKAAALLACLLLPACGSVSYRLREGTAPPRSIAVLPFAGDAPATVRDAARALLQSRLRLRGYEVPETKWVDRVLAEHGWLRDPDRFDATAATATTASEALHVDAVLVGREVDESSFNFVLLRRHHVGAAFTITLANGAELWAAEHGTGSFGGFLLTSGQVFTELRAQGAHGTPVETLSLVDALVADVAETVPARAPEPMPPRLVQLALVEARTTPHDGGQRLVITAAGSAQATLRADVLPFATGVPLVAEPGDGTRYRGAFDLPPGAETPRVVVHARDAFGNETQQEVAR